MQRLIDANALDKRLTNPYQNQTIMWEVNEEPTVLTIPEQPTNGDMQLALYPELEVRDFGSFIEAHSPSVEMRVSKSWWNSPYKRGDIDASNN